MIKVTTWYPDTCDCVTHYSWDDTTSEDDRVHTHHSHANICAPHVGLGGVELHDVLVWETSRMSQALPHVLNRRRDLRASVTDVATKLMVEGVEWELLVPHLPMVDAGRPHDPDDPASAFARMFALHEAHARTLGPILRFDHEYRWSYEGTGANRRLNADVIDLTSGTSALEPVHVEELATFRPPGLQLHGKKAEQPTVTTT